LAAIEEEITKNLAFENAIGVAAKLKRRGEDWDQAIELLKSMPTEDAKKILELLQRSAGA
jgi:uncharacterized protein YajQ (UPF0234 family)